MNGCGEKGDGPAERVLCPYDIVPVPCDVCVAAAAHFKFWQRCSGHKRRSQRLNSRHTQHGAPVPTQISHG